MLPADEIDNISFISCDSTEDMCMICFTNTYSIHDLTCCNKRICTNCVTNWMKKQPVQDSLCVFCKKPNYIFKHTYIDLDEENEVHNPSCTLLFLAIIILLCVTGIYFYSFHT